MAALAAMFTVATAGAAAASNLHAVGGKCTSSVEQQGWALDAADDTIKCGAGCLSEPSDWATTAELEIAPCVAGSPAQNFTLDPATGLVHHGLSCLALNIADKPDALRLELVGCIRTEAPTSSRIHIAGKANPKYTSPKELFAVVGGSLKTKDGAQCISAAPSRPASWPLVSFFQTRVALTADELSPIAWC